MLYLQVLHSGLWLLLISSFKCVLTLRTIDEGKRGTCNFTSIHDSCPQFEGNISAEDLYREGMKISKCMNTQTNENLVDVSGSLECLIRDVQRNLEHRRQNLTKISQILLETELKIQSDHSQKRVQKFKCFYCAIYELNSVLNSTYHFHKNDTESFYLNKENFEIIRRIFTLLLYVNLSQNSSDVMDNDFSDTETWENFFITLTNNTLDTIEIRSKVDRVLKDKAEEKSKKMFRAKNCAFGSECKFRPILWILYTIAIVENGLLIFIFIRHRDMRSDRNTVILNLAIADILSVLCNGALQVIFMYGETFQKVKIYYRIADTSLEITTGVCIYSIVVLSIQRYFAVIPVHKCSDCSVAKRFNSIFFVCVLWIAGCVPQIIHFICNTTIRAWAMRNLILYCVIPIVTMAAFCVMTSWRLRRSVQKIPGEAVRQETARHARIRSSNVLISLIAVFVVSYTPIQLFRFIELWIYDGSYLFDYADLIAYSLLSLNSCFNPIALYVASGTFRRHYNRYLCYRLKNREANISRSNTNVQNTNKTCVLHM